MEEDKKFKRLNESEINILHEWQEKWCNSSFELKVQFLLFLNGFYYDNEEFSAKEEILRAYLRDEKND